MMINVGDYVRTKNGLIFKITGGNTDNWDFDISFGLLEIFEENWLELYRYNDNGSFFNDKNIIKSSPNIIDLIEVGDYVNGRLVEWKSEDFVAFGRLDYVYEEDIKSIVTKEQFKSMEYKIEK